MDNALGTSGHSEWLQTQLRMAEMLHASQRGHAVHQPDVALPAGVNAIRRGQNLSATSQSEWLELQLSNVHISPVAKAHSATGKAHTPWAIAPSDPRITKDSPTQSPMRQRHVHQQLDPNVALGSPAHAAWLERQLRRPPAL